jgi:hypothetical protein
MILSLYAAARVHVCAACGRKGKFVDGWRYVQAPSSPYMHPLVCAVACSAACEALAVETARVA